MDMEGHRIYLKKAALVLLVLARPLEPWAMVRYRLSKRALLGCC